ncbi:hypothetical protein KEM55_003395 [Ascosphaera atra]|nr:hypothetical protein KEM55_003395 [Ascosphaera atra]
MPHKHKRRHGIRDDDIHDLPPTTIAKPLPPKEWKDDKGAANDKGKRNRAAPAEAKPNDAKSAEKSKKKKKAATMADDTPKAFARLMRQMEGKLPSGPTLDDDAEERRKKKKAAKDGEEPSSNDKKDTKETATADANLPKILPGEKLSDFAARVDQMMPLSGISKNRAKTIAGIKLREGRTTKHEKHLRRLQKGWREEEARLKEKEEAERDEKEAEMDEIREKWAALEAEAGDRSHHHRHTCHRLDHRQGGMLDLFS